MSNGEDASLNFILISLRYGQILFETCEHFNKETTPVGARNDQEGGHGARSSALPG